MNENIKSFKSQLVSAQREYIRAKAEHETTKKIEHECKIKILAENEFYTSDHNEINEPKERIISDKSDFRMSDEDFTEYCKLCHAEYLKNGLDVPDYNTTPDYKTFKNLKEAEDKLLKIGIDIIVEREKVSRTSFENVANHWKLRYEAIDLILRLEL